MKFSTIWNSLRVLAVVALSLLLLSVNILYTVPSRRILFNLTTSQAEVAAEETRTKLRLIQDTGFEVLQFNLYAVPMLAIVALLPYARRKKRETVTK